MSYSGTYLIIGPPGTGKTTFLAKQVKEISAKAGAENRAAPVLLCSLTRTAAQELSGRNLPVPDSNIGTLHAHAYRMMERPELAEAHLGEWNEKNKVFSISGQSQAPDLEEASDDPTAITGQSYGDQAYNLYNLYRAQLKPKKLWPQGLQRFAMQWEDWKREAGVLDFTDLIEVAFNSLDCPGGIDVVVTDEVQDQSALELRLIQKWGQQAGALMMAGDPWQSLYEWRGACPDSLFLSGNIPLERRRVLRQSYRVPVAVHKVALGWVKNLSTYDPSIQYDPKPIDGGAAIMAEGTWRRPDPIITRVEKELASGRSVMIAAPCAYMLAPTVAQLRERGLPFANPWRKKRGDWNPLGRTGGTSTIERLLRFLAPDHGTHGIRGRRRWTMYDLDMWAELIKVTGILQRGIRDDIKQQAKLDGDNKELTMNEQELEVLFEESALPEIIALLREADRAALYGGTTPTTRNFMAWIETRLKASKIQASSYPIKVIKEYGGEVMTTEPKLYVGTIHSFKGGEADTVFLFPDLSHSAAVEWEGGAKSRDSVIRMFYVGMTRPKQFLYMAQPDNATKAIPMDWLGIPTI